MKAICKNGKNVRRNQSLVPGTEYHVRMETGFANGKHILRLILDDGTKFSYGSIQLMMRDWKLNTQDDDPALMDTLSERDKRLEELWQDFGDIPMDPETECIEEPFLMFQPGTCRYDIWHWFDERHSKGVRFLLYGEEDK